MRVSRKNGGRGSRRVTLSWAAAVAAASLAGRASGSPDNWNAGSGNWSVAGNWTAGVPGNSSDVLIVESDAVNRVVTYDYNPVFPVTPLSLRVDNTGTGVNTLTQGITTFQLSVLSEIVGYNGQGVFNNLAGSAGNSVGGSGTNALFLGYAASGNGTYNLNGASLSVSSAEYLGYSGHGTFSQTNGTHSVQASMYLGYNAGSVGTYNLSGGTINAGPTEYVGYGGTGVFNQSGGTNAITQTLDVGTGIGAGTNVSGTYTMTGGTLTAQGLTAGNGGTGRFIQSGNSTVTVSSNTNGFNFTVGFNGIGSYAIGGGTGTSVLNVSSGAYVGQYGNGSFSQSAGSSVNFSGGGGLNVGWGSGGVGSYTITGGSLTLPAGIYAFVGNQGRGTYGQTGGSAQLGALYVASVDPLGSGTATLSGGTLNVLGTEQIGMYNSGSFTQTGGVHTVGGPLDVGGGIGAGGSFTLSGGTLTSTDSLFIGNHAPALLGPSTFAQSGTTTASFANTAYVAFATGSTGSYTLTGSASVSFGNGAYVGYGGAGSFSQSGATAVNVAGVLDLGNSIGSSGTYSLGGSAVLATWSTYVGANGNGTFTQTGGTHAITANNGANALYLGFGSAGAGTYALSGGLLTVAAHEEVGYAGPGTFVQSGGTHTVGGYFDVGLASAGSYTLGPGAALSVAGPEALGAGGAGSGTFVQTGGVNNAQSLYVGEFGQGSYTLSGGTLNGGYEIVGYAQGSRPATYVQTGGANNATSLAIGGAPGSGGTATISGGTLVTPSISVGGVSSAGGLGVLNVSNGATVTVTGPITLFTGNNGTSGGTLHFSGGSITAQSLNVDGSPANLDWTGGAFSFSAMGLYIGQGSLPFGVTALTLGANKGLSTAMGEEISAGASVTVNGGTHVIGQTLQLDPGASLTVYPGSTFSFGTFNQSNGAFVGDLTNTTNYNFFGGSLGGALRNQGVANINANFAPTGGIDNSMTMNVASGVTVTPGGFGFLNEGTVSFTNATLAGGTLSNDGVLTGSGAITAALVNSGSLNPTGLLTAASVQNYGSINVPAAVVFRASSVANAGVINLSAGSSVGQPGQPLTNQPGGTLQGAGSVRFDVNNGGGLIVASSATAPLTLFSLTNNAPGGELRAVDGATLNVLSPFTNAGLISLKGSAATFGGGSTVTNMGTVSGVGRFSSPLVNSGVVRAEGGQLTFFSTATNTPVGQIQAPAGATVLFSAGLGPNLGTIALAGGTVDTSTQPLTNMSLIAGNGVLRTGGLLNSGTVVLSDLASQVYGPVTNNGSLKVVSNTTTFYGPITNNGTLKTTAATARFLAPFLNNGVYSSDPSEQSFTDLTVGSEGALVGGVGDRFTLTGDFHSSSARPAVWQTDQAALEFAGGGASPSHVLEVNGSDGGGYTGNFAWGDLTLDAGQSLVLADGDGTPGGALYARVLDLVGAPAAGAGLDAFVASHLVNADGLDPVNVYYDPARSPNAYLNGGTYALGHGGLLLPAAEGSTPEPTGVAILSLAAAGLVGRRRRLATL